MENGDVEGLVQRVIQEFVKQQQQRSEPAYKTELQEERKRRELLERRLNELVEENKRTKQAAEETERGSAIRAELQRLGVAKVDLAFKAVQEGIFRGADGRLMARTGEGEVGMKDYLSSFVSENPEFLPARIPGGSGINATQKAPAAQETVDLERIRPGMSQEEMERVRQEIVRVASQTLRGQ